MSTPEDIIGIVKELRDQEARIDNDINHFEHDEYLDTLYENFPTIAQALLIAVEALEKIADEQYQQQSGHPIKIMPTPAACKAMKALSVSNLSLSNYELRS